MALKYKFLFVFIVVGGFLFTPRVYATPIQQYLTLAGNLNFVVGGGTLRTNPNNIDPCSVTTGPVTAPVNGIPAGSTIELAILYWAGSGSTPDTVISFNGTSITSQRSFTETNTYNGDLYTFWQESYDVTSLVTGNGNYTVNNMTVDNGVPYCTTQQVHAGFALIVIYSNPIEDFRVVNIFDGLSKFWGSSITLTPNNFVIPTSPINGKFGVLSWDGDESVSSERNGLLENVELNGTALTDAGNPLNNQYNSTINPYGTSNNYYGVDWDIYSIDSFLSAGDTSATSTYSSGQDFVLLGAQIFLNTNTPSSDLVINKTHVGDFYLNNPGDFSIGVTNNGPSVTSGITTVTDTLPPNVEFVSALGSGWSCNFIAPTLTCTSSQSVNNGSSFNPITLKVIPRPGSDPQFSNTAEVSGTNFDFDLSNNTSTDIVNVLIAFPDLSTSTKTYQDLNGGEVDVGDVLRFTIELNNTGGLSAPNVSVVDDMPLHIGNLNVISIPTGSANNSTGNGTGANNNGLLDISNITVSSNSIQTIVFEATVLATANPGDTTSNFATINIPTGTNEVVNTGTITISPSLIINSGVKKLYVEHDGGMVLHRTENNSTTNITIDPNESNTYILSPSLQTSTELGAGNIIIPIQMRETGPGSVREIEMTLDYIGAATGIIGTDIITNDFSIGSAWQTLTFSINLANDLTLPIGTQLRLRIKNNNTGARERIRYRELRQGVNFVVNLNSNTVIKVETTETYDAPYNTGNIELDFTPGDTVYIRSLVSDPFGSYDINSASISIQDPLGNPILTNVAMNEVNDSGAATKIYEYAFIIPTGIADGQWNFQITAQEGTEGTIEHTRSGLFNVSSGVVDIKTLKVNSLISDPVRGTANPLRIPGSVIEYIIQPRNEGQLSPDANTVVITDRIPQSTSMCVSTICWPGGTFVRFSDGLPTSNLSFNFLTDVTFSDQPGGGAPYSYTPIPDAFGYDSSVTGFRVQPSGTFSGASGGSPYPNFSILMRVKID